MICLEEAIGLYSIIIAILVVTGAAVLAWRGFKNENNRAGSAIFFTLIVCVIVGLILLAISNAADGPDKERWVKDYKTNIVGLQDSSTRGINGQFYLGIGSISTEEPKFVYSYAINTKESIMPKHIIEEDSNVTFFEDITDKHSPYLEGFYKQEKNINKYKGSKWIIDIGAYFGQSGWLDTAKQKYIFHVPKGTVRRETKVDLQ